MVKIKPNEKTRGPSLQQVLWPMSKYSHSSRMKNAEKPECSDSENLFFFERCALSLDFVSSLWIAPYFWLLGGQEWVHTGRPGSLLCCPRNCTCAPRRCEPADKMRRGGWAADDAATGWARPLLRDLLMAVRVFDDSCKNPRAQGVPYSLLKSLSSNLPPLSWFMAGLGGGYFSVRPLLDVTVNPALSPTWNKQGNIINIA